jgi:hypothetical protein
MLDSRRTLAPDHGGDRPRRRAAARQRAERWAGILASGYLWSDDAEAMVCLVLNVSATPVTITAAKIVDAAGTTIATFNGCDQVTLQPGGRCAVRAKTKQAAGIVKLDGPRGRVRGNCQLNTVDDTILAAVEMR